MITGTNVSESLLSVAVIQETFQIEQASDKTFASVGQFEIGECVTVQESRIKKICDLPFRQ